MAVTGSGTQADPWVVHDYEEFISKSGVYPDSEFSAYIKFEVPGSVLDCNTYGSEFKWGQFTAATPIGSSESYNYYVYIDLNGTTIKNFIIEEDVPMFRAKRKGDTYSWASAHIVVKNGSFRNVFMGSATSKIAVAENDGPFVEFDNVSFSINSTGSTEAIFNGGNGYNMIFDNCALYLVQATLASDLMRGCTVTDTDFELHINNQNSQVIFTDSSFTDCRFQGKIGGHCVSAGVNNDSYVFNQCGLNSKALDFTNCVIDLDLTDSIGASDNNFVRYGVFLDYSGYSINTNVICNSHYPSVGVERQYSYPSSWNHMTHEQIRDATYLNSKGFVVVDVSGS